MLVVFRQILQLAMQRLTTEALDVSRNVFPYEIFETRELTVTLMQKFTETSRSFAMCQR
jgi:hypothetical protein